MEDFWYYGLRLSTDLPFTSLPKWPRDGRPPDLVLRRAPIPNTLQDTIHDRRLLSIKSDGTAFLNFHGYFRMLIFPAGTAVIDVQPDVPIVEIEGYLLSYVAGLILHQRGQLPLHASCVVVDERAIAICGRSGRGKSTLAAAFVRAGHRLLSDDIVVVGFPDGGDAVAVPGSPHLRLNPDSIWANGLDPTGIFEGRAEDQKRIWRREATDFAPVPLAALIRLELAPEGCRPQLTRLSGPGAILPLQDVVYRLRLGCRLGRGGDIAFAALRLAGKLAIHQLDRPQGLEGLDQTVAQIIGAI
jgi:hypothetical protein